MPKLEKFSLITLLVLTCILVIGVILVIWTDLPDTLVKVFLTAVVLWVINLIEITIITA